jgi:hypothetical protein
VKTRAANRSQMQSAFKCLSARESGVCRRPPPFWIYALLFALFYSTPGCKNAEGLDKLLFGPLSPDTPSVVSSFPSALTPSVGPITTLYVEFDRPMDTESARSAFILTGTAPTPGRFRFETNRLLYDLDSPLLPGNAYSMSMQSSAHSLEGAPLAIDYIVHFTAGSRVDAPQITATTPLRGAQGVDPSSSLRFVFSRPMNRASVETAFSIVPSAPGAFTWDSDSQGLTITPYDPLTFGTQYTASISTGAKDPEGIPLSEIFSLDFQAGLDFTRPTITGIFEEGVPGALADGVDGFEKDHYLRIDFSEPMDPLTVPSAISLVKLSDGSIVSGTVSLNSLFDSATFTPADPLEPESTYRLTVSQSARDAAGNNLELDSILSFRVSNALGASNSSYLRIVSVSKLTPLPAQAVSLLADDLTQLTVSPITSTVRLSIVFSHGLARGSVPENISFLKVLGVQPGSGSILSLQFATTSITDDTLLLDLNSFGTNNEYELKFFGGRTSVLSAPVGAETSTWLSTDQSFYLRSTP